MDSLDELLYAAEEGNPGAQERLQLIYDNYRVPVLHAVTAVRHENPEEYQYLVTWRLTRDCTQGYWPWPTVHVYGSWYNLRQQVLQDIAEFARNELVAHGYQLLQVGVLDPATGEFTRVGWQYSTQYVAKTFHSSRKVCFTEEEAWREAWLDRQKAMRRAQ